MQHRAKHQAGGRHRRTDALHSHRAPRTPLVPLVVGERNRYVVTAAALVAGVGVAGVSAAAASSYGAATAAAKANLHPAARTQVSPAPTPVSPTTPAGGVPAGAATGMPTPGQAGVAGLPGAPITVLPGTTPQPAASGGQSGNGGLSWQAPRRKAKPVPVVAWVNPMPGATTTSCFGERWGRMHEGVDLAAPDGTPIRAAGAGLVVTAGPAEGYGNAVLIDHGNGYLTHYGHMSKITVKAGQRVKAGDQIGNEGSTGHSTGPHLHFEVHEGRYKNPVEPTAWMRQRGVDIGGCGEPAGPPKD
ncbi:murein DD-endopeptidase MepM/ murein hydrolase activator NlpD [Krasilnikovia cinnamomea]|uniref:Murein DD-endopeptidase MepM/ murein hydrolase activator NlpD n=1 Tax=Krasilnikovia cinnamomea TaxID=349313 RepID=A0A4Q7ZN15_9ACTN|nr:M23 family metallopeptidase [Krasilnikovia cinnamomea]RZU52051.1 murein DD-endopeptidase MepM/ murein hydrolase activator NlpD [Krasilnikovia cinnamomea]